MSTVPPNPPSNGTGNEAPMPMFQMSNANAVSERRSSFNSMNGGISGGMDIGQLDLEELFVDCYYDVPGMAEMVKNEPANGGAGVAAAPVPVAQKQEATFPGQIAISSVAASLAAAVPPTVVAGDHYSTLEMIVPPQPTMVTSESTAPTSIGDDRKRSADEITSSGDVGDEKANGGQLTAKQKLERRERNREHAKRSRLRKKFLLESLQEQIHGLQEQLDKFKKTIRDEIPAEKAESLIDAICGHENQYTPLPMPSGFGPVKTLMEPDFRLMSALSGSQQNFAISDPTLPDNPIVYVSQGFLDLTGYQLDQVLGRNCRFLQGPGTDQSAVDVIRKGISEGIDTSVCLLNYKADGTPFWNQFFVAALRDAENNVVNYVGVQCEVSKAVVEKHMGEQKKK